MPLYHVHASYIKQGRHQGGASGFARYLRRDGRDEASQLRRYLERDGRHQGKDDLVASGAAHLPRWAHDAEHFFAMADTYERPGWVVARHLQVALPRELSPEGREQLSLSRLWYTRPPMRGGTTDGQWLSGSNGERM